LYKIIYYTFWHSWLWWSFI